MFMTGVLCTVCGAQVYLKLNFRQQNDTFLPAKYSISNVVSSKCYSDITRSYRYPYLARV